MAERSYIIEIDRDTYTRLRAIADSNEAMAHPVAKLLA